MTFESVIDQVTDITGRYDKVDLIKGSINRFVRKISNTGRYPRNLQEVTEANSNNENIVTVALPARFQAVQYVRPSGCKKNLEVISSHNYRSTDYGYYVTGANLIIAHPFSENQIHIGWYIHPDTLVNEEDTNWILDAFENEIVDMVSAYIQGVMGNREAFNSLQAYSEQFLRTMVTNYSAPYGN